jgi:hypothetical protein
LLPWPELINLQNFTALAAVSWRSGTKIKESCNSNFRVLLRNSRKLLLLPVPNVGNPVAAEFSFLVRDFQDLPFTIFFRETRHMEEKGTIFSAPGGSKAPGK